MESANVLFGSPWYWLIAAALLMAAEALLPGMLLLWIGLGAAAVGVFIGVWPAASLSVQLIAFALFTLLSVLAGLKYQIRSRRDNGASTINMGLSTYAGRHVIAVENFQNGRGRVKVNDTFYTALSSDAINGGQSVIVTKAVDGILHVSAVD